MATRSFICKLLPDHSVIGIYCHFDGYPDGVGERLNEYYKNPLIVDQLLELGDISDLHENVTLTVAYHRDRGEDLQPNRVYPSIIDAVCDAHNDLGAEYMYVYSRKRGWAAFETKKVNLVQSQG